jgi:hypothetical protein
MSLPCAPLCELLCEEEKSEKARWYGTSVVHNIIGSELERRGQSCSRAVVVVEVSKLKIKAI